MERARRAHALGSSRHSWRGCRGMELGMIRRRPGVGWASVVSRWLGLLSPTIFMPSGRSTTMAAHAQRWNCFDEKGGLVPQS